MLAIECSPSRIEMRLRTRYLDRQASGLDEALEMIERSCRERKPVSVGLLGNAAEIFPELVRRGVRPDAVTDQTSAHDPVNGYLPAGWSLSEWEERRVKDPRATAEAAKLSMKTQVEAMLAFWRNGREVAHTRTDSRGRYRLALPPQKYGVTSGDGAVVTPAQVTVAPGRYRRVTFRLDTGIR